MDLHPVRNILYEILTAEDDSGDNVLANQQMGVQLSNAVKEKGVTIVQLQSVVNKKVVHKITEGLRLLDTLQQQQLIEEQETPLIELQPRTLEDIAVEKVNEGYDLKSFVDLITAVYVREAVRILGRDRARRQLRIRGETLAKVMG